MIRADMAVAFFPGFVSVRVEDAEAQSHHLLTNRRFNYQATDSPQDLLARIKWRIGWLGRFTGPAYSQRPRIPGIPRELRIALICRWGPAFDVIEFRIYGAFYLMSRMPPRGENAWARERLTAVAKNDDLVDDDDESPTHEPASGSNQPPVDATPPV